MSKPQIRKRTKWLKLPDEYEGFEVEVWVNAPARLWTAVVSPDTEEAEKITALGQIVLGHNDWLDFEGRPYPPPSDAGFWEEIPTELAAVLMVACQAEMSRLPNSMAPQRRR